MKELELTVDAGLFCRETWPIGYDMEIQRWKLVVKGSGWCCCDGIVENIRYFETRTQDPKEFRLSSSHFIVPWYLLYVRDPEVI